MQPSTLFAAPFEWIVAPLLPAALWLLIASCLLGIAADLTGPTEGFRGRLATLCAVLGLVVVGRGWFAFDSWAGAGFMLTATGVLIAYTVRFGCPASSVTEVERSPLWIGFAIIVAAFAVKCIALDSWPPNLNTYAAMTGEEGLKVLEGRWPAPLFGIRAYPLSDGGQSPLHLPILLASMKAFGGTVFAVRFAEVVGSTLLLVVLWVWVRSVLPRLWAASALAVFAFSPWHLMQSRFGTFYSLCATLALTLLWLAESARDRRRGVWGLWIAFGACAGAISWAYAPLQVLYPFFAAIVVAGFLRPGRRWEPLLAVGAFALLIAFQISQGGKDALMRANFGQLATDTVIWRKNAADVITREAQPLTVVLDNFAHNAHRWFRESFNDVDILVWWAPAMIIGAIYAMFELRRPATWIRSLYFLIGLLPPLVIFPLHRRTLIVWPLVYVAGVRFCRELVEAARQCRNQPWMGQAAMLFIVIALGFTSLHGLRSYAVGNPAALVYPYFGPPDQYLMFDEAKRMVAEYDVVFINPGIVSHVINIELHEPARATGRARAFELVTIRENHDRNRLLAMRDGCKKAFIYLNDEQHKWVGQQLQATLPGGKMVEHRGNDLAGPPLYFIYFFPAE